MRLCALKRGCGRSPSEMQVGGRFDADVGHGTVADVSEPGSLPCPLFPHRCQCAHVPLSTIQRALLHPDNRGVDGAEEDVDSPGLSPHKVFLMARRRRAEAQMKGLPGGGLGAEDGRGGDGLLDGGGAGPGLRESMLVRTATEMRHITSTSNPLAGIATTLSGGWGGDGDFMAVLADKRDELTQLRVELQASPVTDVIPALQLRSCCLCERPFAVFEGAQCLHARNEHFLCNVCFGIYLMKACAPGGSYEQELRNEENMVVSPPGKLPCPFFRGHYPLEQQLPLPKDMLRGSLPAMDCQCGAVFLSVIEHALLDPRNCSAAFWRERQAHTVLGSLRALARTNSGSLTRGGSGGRLVGVIADELLSRNFTPFNVHETARLRVSVLKNEWEKQEALTHQPSGVATDESADALAELHTRVIDALDRGGKIACPACGMQCVKDDACVHMDTCPCGSNWCFLCGKPSGSGPGQCQRGSGCDAQSCYLENHTGWGDFGINGETPAQGAQKEYLRRRQAFLVRTIKQKTDPQLWDRLRNQSPGLLKDVPTDGRDIDWDTLDTAEMPLFGSNAGTVDGADVAAALLGGGDFAMDVDAARRLEEHFAEERGRAELEAYMERRLKYRKVAFMLILLVVVGGTLLLANVIPKPNALEFIDPPAQKYTPPLNMSGVNCTLNSVWRAQNADIAWPNGTICAPPPPPPIMASYCWEFWNHGCDNIRCKLIYWIPMIEVAVANIIVLGMAIVADLPDCAHYVLLMMLEGAATALCLWPVLVGPFGHWSYTLIAGPICAGAVPSLYVAVVVGVLLDMDWDDEDDVIVSLASLLGMAGYLTNLIASIQVRKPVEIHDPVPTDGCIHSDSALAQEVKEAEADHVDASVLTVVTCTPSCEGFRIVIMIVTCTAVLGVLATFVRERHQAQRSWFCTVPVGMAAACWASSWPLLLDADTLATSGPWLYLVVLGCLTLAWVGGLASLYLAIEDTWLVQCARLDMGAGFLLAGPVASWMLLYVFRSSRLDDSFIDPPLWSEIYKWEGVSVMTLFILALPVFIEHEEDWEEVFFTTGAFLGLWGVVMLFTISSWAFNSGCFILVSCWWCVPPLAISIAIKDIMDEDNCRGIGAVFAGFAAIAVTAGWVVMLTVFYVVDDYVAPGDITGLPTAFAVTGASQMGANGLYIVRNDLADSTCIDEDKKDSVEEFCDICSNGADAASRFYHLVPGCETQKCVEGQTQGLMLYQVFGSTMWVVAEAEHAVETCGKDPSSVIHSPMVACYHSPSGEGCTSDWMEVINGSVWMDAPSLSIADSDAPAAAISACQPSVLLLMLLIMLYML
jgi:hypothetical protein